MYDFHHHAILVTFNEKVDSQSAEASYAEKQNAHSDVDGHEDDIQYHGSGPEPEMREDVHHTEEDHR